jgi:hypothetical protein
LNGFGLRISEAIECYHRLSIPLNGFLNAGSTSAMFLISLLSIPLNGFTVACEEDQRYAIYAFNSIEWIPEPRDTHFKPGFG